MGYLKDRHGMMMLDNVPPDTCPECAVVHDPQQPHNRDSLYYQYKFYDAHGCWPTCRCDGTLLTRSQGSVAEELKKRGVEIGRVTQ